MLSIPDAATAATILAQPLDPDLHKLIAGRFADAAAIGLADLPYILVIQPGDTEAMIEEALGWSPLTNPIDQIRYNEPSFIPYWSWLEDLDGWYELVHPVGNEGFAYILLIEWAEGVLPELLSICGEHGGP